MKKKVQYNKKKENDAPLKKKITKNNLKKQKKQIEDDPLDEEIDSEFLESEDIQFNQNDKQKRDLNLDDDDQSDQNEKSRENADDQRIKLAKRILLDTKTQVLLEQKFNDENYKFDKGIELNEEDRKINDALQNQILSKKNLIYSEVADRVINNPTTSYYKGHKKCITSSQFDPFNQYMFTTSKDCSIINWNIETKQKTFISLGKDDKAHKYDILTASINFDGKILATSGSDRTVKLWDTHNSQLITTLRGHRGIVHAIKFGLNSNNLASVACDRTLKLWDVQAQALIDTFYGHQSDANDLDAVSEDAFISGGYDRHAILWKTKYGSQLIFNGHDYSIDCIRGLTPDYFATGSQDSSIQLWTLGRKKPVWSQKAAHGEGKWITALGSNFNTNLLASGSYNDKINLYKFNGNNKQLEEIHQIQSNGIVNNLTFTNNSQFLASVESEEHRLGRWITAKAKNRVILYRLW